MKTAAEKLRALVRDRSDPADGTVVLPAAVIDEIATLLESASGEIDSEWSGSTGWKGWGHVWLDRYDKLAAMLPKVPE